jgi:small subunit ribosomal protein S7e
MFTALNKIRKDGDEQPTAFETSVAQALFDLGNTSAELKADLREVYITAAKEVDVGSKKAIVVIIPHKQLKVVHKIQAKLIWELEKKFSGRHVIIIAQRRILAPETRGSKVKKQKRPYSRTTAAVHQVIFFDIFFFFYLSRIFFY